MLKKLLIPLAILSSFAGLATSFAVGPAILHPSRPVAREVAIEAPKTTPTRTPTPTPTPLTTVLPSQKYAYISDRSPDMVEVMLKTGKNYTTYSSNVDQLRNLGKCVVNFYSESINGDYTSAQQQVTSEKLVQQYTNTLNVKTGKTQEGTLLSSEAYGMGDLNYKIDAAYATFTAKAVHGVAYARIFNNGVGFVTSVTCPSTTTLPNLSSTLRIKTDFTQAPPKYYPDDHRFAF